MSDEEKKYSIGELARLAGISRRAVRYYVQRCLISQPIGRGRGGHYSDEHLEQILRIKSLQRDGVPLDRMEAALQGKEPEASFEPERMLIVRIKLSDGVFLEVSQGMKMPSGKTLQQITNLLEKDYLQK